MHISLGRALHGTAAIFFALAVGSAASVYLSLAGMAQDGRVVNLAGVVRGGSQHLVKQELAGKPADKLLARLDGLVRGLVAGDADAGLPVATDVAFIARMAEVSEGWTTLKSKIAAARSQPAGRSGPKAISASPGSTAVASSRTRAAGA